MAIEPNDNELLTLEIIHRYVEVLDKYFGNVSENYLIYTFPLYIFFCVAIEPNDNELLILEIIHRYAEVLDKFFSNVSENYLIYIFSLYLSGL